MENSNINALYEQAKVNGRSESCPRKGIYRVLKIYNGNWYNKPAKRAVCNWKASITDDYQLDFKVDIQLESLKKNASLEQIELLMSNEILNRELHIVEATYNIDERLFYLKWELLETKRISVTQLNELLKSGDESKLVDSIINSLEDYSLDDDFDQDFDNQYEGI